MSRPILLVAFALLASTSAAAHATYLEELIHAARAARLAADREWLDLVHYRPNLIGSGYTSLAEAPPFFNAPDGKTNPDAELAATLAAFFDLTPETFTSQPRQCRFIARYHWLEAKLHFDPARLPPQRCDRFEAWYRAMAPRQITLVFPAAYVNNPSSMFGHTLLRIDSTGQSSDTRLFSYALNYAAATDETNGVVFAFKGLLGGYPGFFSTMPYYKKVKEYNDLENRDIWEYELTLTAGEIRRLLEHAWELGQVNFDYYFFDENCSYQLLALLDVARPGHGLVDRFRGWAIPSDTVRAVLEDEGILRSTRYRPSNLTRIQYASAALAPEERRIARALAAGAELTALNGLDTARHAPVLDLAYDYLQYRFVTEGLPREQVAGSSMALLRQRSTTPPSAPLAPPMPRHRPDEGHGTARLALGAGVRDDENYLEFRLRPAYHDLVDPLAGYTPGAQINFLDLRARWQVEAERLELESFRVVEIASLTPRDDFFSPTSWHIDAGIRRLPLIDIHSPGLMPSVSGGAGLAYRRGADQTIFLFADTLLAADDDLPHGYSVGLGPYGGYLIQQERASLIFSAQAHRLSGVWEWFGRCGIEGGIAITKNLALRLTLERVELAGGGATDASIGIHGYF